MVDRLAKDTEATIAADLSKPAPPPKAAPKVGLPNGGIPGFTMGRRLGVGGMGQVYQATRLADRREVAIKLLRADTVADPEFQERFKREAIAMREVTHPNVVGILDAGDHEGWLWIATEYLPDGDLQGYLSKRGELFEKDALTMTCKIAAGLTAIHTAGLVHRDIKPQNVFLDHHAKDGGDVKLGDLGMARHTSGEDRMTMTGTACGTPSYMAPEQLRGESDIDCRADTYALGVLMFTLVTGREPFIGDTVFTVSHAALNDLAPDVRRFRPDASPAVVAIVRKALAKPRAERYQSADDLRDDCARALRGERPVHAGVATDPPPSRQRTSELLPGAKPVGSGHGSIAVTADGLPIGSILRWLALATLIIIPLTLAARWTGNSATNVASSQGKGPTAAVVRDLSGFACTVTVGTTVFPMRWCPTGTFTMGSPAQEPDRCTWETSHLVRLSQGFWIGTHEITHTQWQAVMGDEGSQADDPNLPITGISQAEAQAFCAALNLRLPGLDARLPHEAEWEYACRAGTTSAFSIPLGDEPLARDLEILSGWDVQPRNGHPNEEALRLLADSALRRGVPGVRPAGYGMPNRWAIQGMPGNVQEWCLDHWNHHDPTPDSGVTDPLTTEGPLAVVRGGSWLHPEDRARSAARDGMDPDSSWPWIGFRIVVPGGAAPAPLPTTP